MDITTIAACIIGGIVAGLGNGFIGASASATLAPVLIALTGIDPYMAIAYSLSADTLASVTSSVVYARNKHVDVKNGAALIVPALIFAIVGSYIASKMPSASLGCMTMIFMIVLGVAFLRRSFKSEDKDTAKKEKKQLPLAARQGICAACGALIGLLCGLMGAGGGMMIFIPLVMFLGYEVRTGVGTGVAIMAIMACVGAVSHFSIAGVASIAELVLCVGVSAIVSPLAAALANHVNTRAMYRITGIVLFVLGVVVLAFYAATQMM